MGDLLQGLGQYEHHLVTSIWGDRLCEERGEIRGVPRIVEPLREPMCFECLALVALALATPRDRGEGREGR